MHTLIVLAHPLPDSLAAHLATQIRTHFETSGENLRVLDLYRTEYDPCLSAHERQGYYKTVFEDAADLGKVERLILVFPTWWFGMPAILKGWIDRSFLPGIAYDHANDLSALSPRLNRLKHVLAVTTLGSPAWVDHLIVRRPVFRSLKWGTFKACAPKARFRMLSLYNAEKLGPDRLRKFETRLKKTLEHLR